MKVYLSQDDIAPRAWRWHAMDVPDFDLGVKVGSGATPLEAIEDLLWHLDIEDINPRDCEIVWRNEEPT